MALFELISFLREYRAKHIAEGLRQRDLLSKEAKLIAAALGVIVLLMGGLVVLALYLR